VFGEIAFRSSVSAVTVAAVHEGTAFRTKTAIYIHRVTTAVRTPVAKATVEIFDAALFIIIKTEVFNTRFAWQTIIIDVTFHPKDAEVIYAKGFIGAVGIHQALHFLF
jgi:diacylglycerol kinase